MAKVLILGTGAWGTALGNILLQNKHEIYMYGINKKEINDLNHQINTNFFGNKKLDRKINLASDDLGRLLLYKPDYILIAVPSIYIDELLTKVIILIKNKPIFINVAKGLNRQTNSPFSKHIKKITKNYSKGLVSIIGPSFAIEVFKNQPTIVNAISNDIATAKKVAKLFNNDHFKCVEITDELGAELSAALKNVIAIACGITFQLHTSINTRAAILAQGTKEIYYLVNKMGGKSDTVLQMCGIGDIFLTCSDDKSRNFSFGKEIALKGIEKTLLENKNTVEGYETLLVAKKLIDMYKINAPVINCLYNVIYMKKDPYMFVENIMKKVIK